jgi:hypothetical protein
LQACAKQQIGVSGFGSVLKQMAGDAPNLNDPNVRSSAIAVS